MFYRRKEWIWQHNSPNAAWEENQARQHWVVLREFCINFWSALFTRPESATRIHFYCKSITIGSTCMWCIFLVSLKPACCSKVDFDLWIPICESVKIHEIHPFRETVREPKKINTISNQPCSPTLCWEFKIWVLKSVSCRVSAVLQGEHRQNRCFMILAPATQCVRACWTPNFF